MATKPTKTDFVGSEAHVLPISSRQAFHRRQKPTQSRAISFECGLPYTLRYVRKKLTAIRLKPEQVEKLEKTAVKEDLPVSWLIRRAIDEFLKRRK